MVESHEDSPETITLTILHHGTKHDLTFPSTATLEDLTIRITEDLSIPATHQKFMISPKIGLLKPPYPDPTLPLAFLTSKRIQLLAPLPQDITHLAPPTRPTGTPLPRATPARTINQRKIQDSARYTFHKITPLTYLPNPERSQRFLERLANDAGIKSAMAKHHFSVGLLTEMNPAEHTTHESKTLGLNRNHGEVIELRLRTDAYDGYRDYKTIRRTLCHELAHNVHSEHDRKFWDLMAVIEKDVERADWTRGGHRVGEDEFYNPDDQGVGADSHVDAGGWQGGEYTLGGGGSGSGSGSGSGLGDGGSGASTAARRREAMAQAAEARMRRQKETERDRKT